MKGTILDFDNIEKNGLILGEDGNRYHFSYEKDWKNKNKNVEIDIEVDFIIVNNSATEIFSLNKKNNSFDEQIIEKNEIIDKSFVKINSSSMKSKSDNINLLKKRKKENIKKFFYSLILPILIYSFLSILHQLDLDAVPIVVILLLFLFISILLSILALINIFFTKGQLEREDKNKEKLKILNFLTENFR